MSPLKAARTRPYALVTSSRKYVVKVEFAMESSARTNEDVFPPPHSKREKQYTQLAAKNLLKFRDRIYTQQTTSWRACRRTRLMYWMIVLASYTLFFAWCYLFSQRDTQIHWFYVGCIGFVIGVFAGRLGFQAVNLRTTPAILRWLDWDQVVNEMNVIQEQATSDDSSGDDPYPPPAI